MTSLSTMTLTFLVASTALSGCSEWAGCTTSVEPGVVVEIRDAVDGTPIAATASASVTEGSFQDSLRLYDGSLTRAGADEREGTYTLRVFHTGYVTWEQAAVRVRDRGCHVETVTLQANLQRVP
jgi:hypothetical protein